MQTVQAGACNDAEKLSARICQSRICSPSVATSRPVGMALTNAGKLWWLHFVQVVTDGGLIMNELTRQLQPPEENDSQGGKSIDASVAAPALNTPTAPPETAPMPLAPSTVPLLLPKRKVDLATVEMSGLPATTPVEQLLVREVKGISTPFTPNLESALSFRGLVHKPEGEFDKVYQLVGGSLLNDPHVAGRLQTIVFAPTYSWATCEVVLAPWKMTKYGAHVLKDLQLLQPRFPNLKVFVEWSDLKRRHVVYEVHMTPQDRELISKVTWPHKDQIDDALQLCAFDNIDDLAAANAEIKTLLGSREVE